MKELFEVWQGERDEPLPQQDGRDNGGRCKRFTGQTQDAGGLRREVDHCQRDKPGRGTTQKKIKQLLFYQAIRSVGAEKVKRVRQEKEHEDDDDVGRIDHQQAEQREFIPRL